MHVSMFIDNYWIYHRTFIPGGALFINFLLPPEPQNFEFSQGVQGVIQLTTPNLQVAWRMVKTMAVP